MVLNRKREAVDPILEKIVSICSSISPDVFTWLALISAIIAAFFFYISSPQNELRFSFLLSASLFVFLNGLFDAVDGKLAKLHHLSSKRGDFLDHAIDRFADVFIVGGLSLSSWCHLEIGFFAMIGMLLTSYMGTQAQAVGMNRVYSGLLGRADRLVLLIIAPVIQHILYRFSLPLVFGYSFLDWTLLYLAIVGIATSVQRFMITLKYFKEKKKENK